MTNEFNGRARKRVAVRLYLSETYWWAQVHPRAISFFKRQWLASLILWGNLDRLSDAAIAALGQKLTGRTAQVACVNGDLTQRLAQRLARGGPLDVVGVLPFQLDNLARKISTRAAVALIHGDSAELDLPAASYGRGMLFFLLHEQPEAVRVKTLAARSSSSITIARTGGICCACLHRFRAGTCARKTCFSGLYQVLKVIV